jgi:two-component sensor histidine kinase
MIKESHHRIKNNLQAVSSLLELNAGFLTDKKALSMIRDSQSRINAMALIHEKLYLSKTLAGVVMEQYLEDLCDSLMITFGVKNRGIELRLDVEDITINSDTAVPCGLMINELVSNAMKHAFNDGAGGMVEVKLSRERKGGYLLVMRDNGSGIPDGMDLEDTDTIGLMLVRSLAQQLGGSVDMKTGEWTEFIIRFNEYEEAPINSSLV